jgi:hypothetical protein
MRDQPGAVSIRHVPSEQVEKKGLRIAPGVVRMRAFG